MLQAATAQALLRARARSHWPADPTPVLICVRYFKRGKKSNIVPSRLGFTRDGNEALVPFLRSSKSNPPFSMRGCPACGHPSMERLIFFGCGSAWLGVPRMRKASASQSCMGSEKNFPISQTCEIRLVFSGGLARDVPPQGEGITSHNPG